MADERGVGLKGMVFGDLMMRGEWGCTSVLCCLVGVGSCSWPLADCIGYVCDCSRGNWATCQTPTKHTPQRWGITVLSITLLVAGNLNNSEILLRCRLDVEGGWEWHTRRITCGDTPSWELNHILVHHIFLTNQTKFSC